MIDITTLELGIAHIKRIREADRQVTKTLKMLNDNFSYFSFGWIEDDYMKLLSIALDDRADWLAYFVYECDLGNKPMKVVTTKGKEIKLKTVEQLYKLITED